MCVCGGGTHCVCLLEKVDGCLCVFLLYVYVVTTFVSKFGQFQVLMVLPESMCECCVVSVTCVSVCVCVFRGTPLCLPVRKVDGCLCVFLLYVFVWSTFVSMLGHFQALMAPPDPSVSAVW